MSESKHTPGPWTVILRGERGTFHIPQAQKHEAERSDDGHDGYSVSSANRDLIAAAPDLLEALQLTTSLLNGLPDPEQVAHGIAKALAAISKAQASQ